jgi:hypothetical protein
MNEGYVSILLAGTDVAVKVFKRVKFYFGLSILLKCSGKVVLPVHSGNDFQSEAKVSIGHWVKQINLMVYINNYLCSNRSKILEFTKIITIY